MFTIFGCSHSGKEPWHRRCIAKHSYTAVGSSLLVVLVV